MTFYKVRRESITQDKGKICIDRTQNERVLGLEPREEPEGDCNLSLIVKIHTFTSRVSLTFTVKSIIKI